MCGIFFVFVGGWTFSHLQTENMAFLNFVVVRSPSNVWLFVTPWTASCQASLSLNISWNLLKFMSIELVMSSNHIVLCRPLLLLSSVFPSIRVFSSESVLPIRWPKYWSFSFSISPSNEYSRLISFRMDWLDLRAVQGTLKSLLQHHTSKASTLPFSASVSSSHPLLLLLCPHIHSLLSASLFLPCK